MIDLLEKSKYPIIVLEGPDGTGKTSLAMNLRDYLGAEYLHLTYRWPEKMQLYHYAAIRWAAHKAQHSPVIVDRWWVSEIVYAEAYRGGSKFMKHYFMLEHIANKIGVVYVMCLPEEHDRYLAHYNELKGKRAEMYDEGMEKVYQGYDWFYRNYMGLRENVCHYDMFKNFQENDVSRDIVLRSISQKILEFSEDHRSTI